MYKGHKHNLTSHRKENTSGSYEARKAFHVVPQYEKLLKMTLNKMNANSFSLIRLAKIHGCREADTIIHYKWENKFVQVLWRMT